MSIVPIDSFEQWMGPDAAPNWKGARFRIRKPFVSREDYREVSARQLLELSLFRHVPHAAKALQRRTSRFLLPADLDGSQRIAGADPAARGQQFGGVPRAVHRPDERRPAIALFTNCCTSACLIARSSSIVNAVSSASRPCRKRATPSNRGARSSSWRRCSIVRARSASTTAASSSCRPITAPILQPLGFNGRSDSLSLVPGPSTVRLPATSPPPQRRSCSSSPPTGPARSRFRKRRPLTSMCLRRSSTSSASRALRQTRLMFTRDPRQPRTRLFGMYRPAPMRFPKAYLDRLDLLTIDGRVLDAASWNVQRLIWRPDVRLEERDVDLGPRSGQSLMPGRAGRSSGVKPRPIRSRSRSCRR